MKLNLTLAALSIVLAFKSVIYTFIQQHHIVSFAFGSIGLFAIVKWSASNLSLKIFRKICYIKLKKLSQKLTRLRKFEKSSLTIPIKDPLSKTMPPHKMLWEFVFVLLLVLTFNFVSPSLPVVLALARIVFSWMLTTLIMLALSKKFKKIILLIPFLCSILLPCTLALFSYTTQENFFVYIYGGDLAESLAELWRIFGHSEWMSNLLIDLQHSHDFIASALNVSLVLIPIFSPMLIIYFWYILGVEYMIQVTLRMIIKIDRKLELGRKLDQLSILIHNRKQNC